MKLFSQSLSPPSFYLLLSLIVGIIAGKVIPASVYFPLIFLCFFILGVGLFVCFFHRSAIYIICAVFFSIGILSIQFVFYPTLAQNHVAFNMLSPKIPIVSKGTLSHKKTIVGRVQSFTKHYPEKAKLILSTISIKDAKNDSKSITGKIKLTIYGIQNLPKFGDVIEFKSRLKPFRNFSNPGGFDYIAYMKSKGIYGSAYTNAKDIKYAKTHLSVFSLIIRKIEQARIGYFQHILSVAYKDDLNKDKFEKQILISLMTGKKEVLSSTLRDLFSKAGISHLLAISGLHLSIVGFLFFVIFYQMLSFFPRVLVKGRAKKFAVLFAVFPIAGYAVFSGFSASTQRALIMAVVLLFSLTCEKEKDIFSSLCVAGIIILLLNPAALFSISFQLSFSAVLFIIGGMSAVSTPLWVHKYKLISNSFSILFITVLAGLGTLPFTAHYFNIISHIQLLTNLVAIPLTTFIVLPLGFLGFAFFSWLPSVSSFFIGVCLKGISCLIRIAETCVAIPFSWSRIYSFSWFDISIFYLFIFCLFLFLKQKRKKAAVLFILTVILFFSHQIKLWIPDRAPPLLLMTALDIGQGNSALIQTPDQKSILVDGGGFSDDSGFDTGRFVIAPFLWKNNIKHLDYVILTHPEADHLNGLIFILNHFKVSTLIKNTDTKKSKAYLSLLNACEKKSIRIFNPDKENRQISLGQTNLMFFSSSVNIKSKKKSSKHFNNNSLVFKLSYKNFTMLFTGDILKEREAHLTREYGSNLQSGFLLAPHHGSNTSSTKVFLDKVQPKSVIISCAWRNRYGFPHFLVLERYKDVGSTIFRTDNDGAIIIKSDGHNHQIKTFKGG